MAPIAYKSTSVSILHSVNYHKTIDYICTCGTITVTKAENAYHPIDQSSMCSPINCDIIRKQNQWDIIILVYEFVMMITFISHN